MNSILKIASQVFLFSIIIIIPIGQSAFATEKPKDVRPDASPGEGLRIRSVRIPPPIGGSGNRHGTSRHRIIIPDDAAAGEGTGIIRSPQATDPVTLTVGKLGSDLQLTWTGGSAPYRISYSPDGSFQDSVQTLATEISSNIAVVSADPSKNLECFAVTDGSTISPAVQGIGYDPEPAPVVDSISADEVWWGDTVTLGGSYFDKIAVGNIMFFNHRPQKATGATPGTGSYATDASFVVPDDTRSGYVFVESHGKVMDPGIGLALIPPVGPYTNIRSVTYASNTGRIWVSADNIIEDIEFFVHSPAAVPGHTITSLANPHLSRMTTGGLILAIDGVNGIDKVKKINTSNGQIDDFADTKHGSFQRDILPIGIAASPDGLWCFIADANTGFIVKIPAGNTTSTVDHYGGFTWAFSDPEAMDGFDQFTVLANDTRGFVRIATGASSSFTGFFTFGDETSMEIDWDVSNPLNVFQSAEEMFVLPSAQAYNLNSVAPSGNIHNLGAFVEGRPDGKLELDPQMMWTFFPQDYPPAAVIINNSGRSLFTYPSPKQVADRVLEMKAQGWVGLKVRLEVIDPPDLAGYAQRDLNSDNGWPAQGYPYRAGDNKGTDDFGLMTTQTGSPSSTIDPLVQSDGTVTFYLKVPDDYSGENFQVAVHKCNYAGACDMSKTAYLSLIHTSWKRIFVERDKMFRKGGILSRSFDTTLCAPDCNVINLFSGANVDLLDQIAVFDETATNTFESGNAEIRTVSSLSTNGDGSIRAALDLPLSKNHLATDDDGGTPGKPLFSNGHSAGNGVISGCDLASNQINSGNSCFYETDLRAIQSPYADGFVELLAPRIGMSALPYLKDVLTMSGVGCLERRFSQIWFHHFSPGLQITNCTDGVTYTCSRNNYLHLAAGIREGGANLPGGSVFDGNWSYVFQEGVTNDCSKTTDGCDDQKELRSNQSTVAHEIGHQFRVNQCINGHDLRNAWCGTMGGACVNPTYGDHYCLMYIGPDPRPTKEFDMFADGLDHFCEEDLLLGDPTCPNPTPPAPRQGAIRTEEDPI